MKDRIVRSIHLCFGCLKEERGIGVVEIILILLVLVGLVLIFKNQIVSIANAVFSSISSQINSL